MKPKKTAVEKIAPVEVDIIDESNNSLKTQIMFELQKPAFDSRLTVPVYQTP